jgi:predicted glycosyltransferase involved in capsule biosynthesis
MAKASVIIRFTNKSPHRVNNLMALIRHISKNPNVEIIVSAMEEDVKYPKDIEKLKFGRNPKRAKLIHNFSRKKFASTVANNIGASLANTDVLIFQDADILFHNSNYDRIIERIRKGAKAIRVGEDCLNLSMENTKKIQVEAKANKQQSIYNHFKKMEGSKKGCRDAPGACTAVSRKAFIEIGGWCERFLVYGWEDCHFRYKVKKLGKDNYKSLQAPMLHLAHEVNYQSKHQPDNANLYSQLVSANAKEYASLLSVDRKDLLAKYPQIKQKK